MDQGPRVHRNCCTYSDNLVENNNNVGEKDVSQVAEFYNGRSIFITGATGFLGKVLIEKLLRCCPGVKTLYLLLRNKRGQDVKQRLETIINSKAFDRIRKDDPEAFEKLVAVSGDISEPGLGISQEDLKNLAQNVSVVFHSAATVKFDEPLKISMTLNVLGTRQIGELCHKLPHLQALVHVSTAYCNCNLPEVYEEVYPPPVDPQKLLDFMEWMDDELQERVTTSLLGRWPNTYTFTKALAETLLVNECGGLPVAIIRPSIVTSAWKEPYPGWVDNINGPTGLLAAIAKGLIRTVWLDGKVNADFIPVDIVIDLMLSVAWNTATRKPNNVMVYNCTSGCTNTLKWSLVSENTVDLSRFYPSSDLFRAPGGMSHSSKLLYQLHVAFAHYLPAICLDAACIVTGRKPKLVKLYNRVHKSINSLQYFVNNEWIFHCQNVCDLQETMTPADRKLFNVDIRQLSWGEYFATYVLGIRQFVLKESDDTLPAARKVLRRMLITGHVTNVVLVLVLLRLLALRSTTAGRVWSPIGSMLARLGGSLVPTALVNYVSSSTTGLALQ